MIPDKKDFSTKDVYIRLRLQDIDFFNYTCYKDTY